MIGATVLTLMTGGAAGALIPLVVGLALVFIAYGRSRWVPHRASSDPSPLRSAGDI